MASTSEESLWSATAAPLAPLPALREAVRAQVAVIGAGYTGLSAALHLGQAGRDVVVLDALELGAADYCGAPFEKVQIQWLLQGALGRGAAAA